MRLLVTGGAGFVGSHFVEQFHSEQDLVIVDDLSNGSLSNIRMARKRSKFIRADVSKEATMRRIGKVNGVFHLACHPRSFSFNRPTKDVDVNLRATMNMLELARKSDAKIIFTSNSGIYGDPQYLPMDEQHPIDCKTPYDVNKYASELQMLAYRKQYGLKTVACRLATVYGPRQRVNEKLGWRPLVATFLQYVLKGKQPVVFGDGEQTRDLIYVKDVVKGLMGAFKSKAEGEAFNLSTGIETSVNATLKMVAETAGKQVEPRHGPPSIGELKRMCCSNSKAQHSFGFTIDYPLKEALREYVDWYRTQSVGKR